MCGIADGVTLIHNLDLLYPLSMEDANEYPPIRLSIRPGEERYGRHGDIKPKNILWFKNDPEVDDPKGVLKVTGFGLGRFHGRDSRSKENPRTVGWSPTYEPPEHPNFSDDYFFSLTTGGDEPVAQVRDGVIEWVKELHQHEKCSALFHDFLLLIMEKMLVIDTKKQIEAADLQNRMNDFVRKADEEYLLEPKSWPKEAGSSRLPLHEKRKKPHSRGLNVTFSETTIQYPERSLTQSLRRTVTCPTQLK